MNKEFNLKLYKGNGQTITERGLELQDYEPFLDDKPKGYVAGPGLRNAVNVAIALGQPLLVTGDPGTGKTKLAESIAYELDVPLLKFYTKTTSTATDLFYRYDALRHFQDTNLESLRMKPSNPEDNEKDTDINSKEKKNADINDYITYNELGQAIFLSRPPESEERKLLPEELRGRRQTRSVVLIDEIDKAPRDLPNDILNEIENMEFTVKETKKTFKTDKKFRPILVLTSNSEKNLPDAFLRRCVFYHIAFPSGKDLENIIQNRFKDRLEITPEFIKNAIDHFNEIGKKITKKKPATAELLAWIYLIADMKLDPKDLKNLQPDQKALLTLSYSVLAKNKEDLNALKRNL